MKIIKLTDHNDQQIIEQTIEVLQNGGLVIFPTETTYGAGVDATDQQAVDKLLAYKGRREGKPLSIAVADQAQAEKYVELNDSAKKNYDRYLPGPITIISQSKHNLAKGVESEFGTLGVRIPDYQLVLQLLTKFGQPITATSANASGKKRPYKIGDLLDNLSKKQKGLIDLIIDAGELPHNPPSTVIDTTLSTPITVRSGANKLTEDQKSITQISNSEQETKDIAGKIMLANWNQIKNHGLIIALDGPLGAGKTIFTKGVAQFLQINETITSPTYTYIEEYEFDRHHVQGKLFHLDVWKIDSEDLFAKLEFEKLIGANNVIVMEWWDNVAHFDSVKKIVSNTKTDIIHISVNDKRAIRELIIDKLNK